MTKYQTGKQCPPPDELSKFSTGQLPGDLVDDIGEHIEHCQTCSDTIALLNDKSDTLVTGLRQGETSPEACDDADRDRVVKLIREVGPENSATPSTLPPDPQPDPVAMQQLLADLSSSGLLTTEEVAEVVQSLPIDRRGDTQELAKALVRSGKLTKFQATAVYQGKTRGLVFGEYVVLDKIGAGGMGMVYRAIHRRMKREVAIKVLPGGSLDNANAIDRFYREVEAAAKLLHPNIVTAFDAGQHGKSHFLVMEYVAGQDLSQIVKQQGSLPVATAVEFIMQAAQGLEYAHGEGLVHRDIKPANLLVDKKGTVKILDMGLARLTDIREADDGLTKSGQIMGTVDYMAPEQATNTRTADARADIYSLGCTLYRLLTDSPVFTGDTIMNKMVSHMQAAPPSLRAFRQDVPEALDAVYQRMLAKQPDARQQSMREVIQQLRESIADADVSLGAITGAAGDGVGEHTSDSRLTQHFQDITPTSANSPTNTQVTLEPTITLNAPVTAEVQPGSLEQKPQVLPNLPSRVPPRIALTMGGAAFVLLLTVVVMFFRTPNGVLRVEIMDPQVELTIKGTEYVLKGTDSQDIKLTVGEHILHVKRNEFEFDTKSLTLKKGETIVVRIELLDGTVQVVSNGNVIGQRPLQPLPNVEPPTDPTPQSFALEFDGKDDYVELPSFPFDLKNPLTLEAWFTALPCEAPDSMDQDAQIASVIFADDPTTGMAGLLMVDRSNAAWWFGVDDNRFVHGVFYRFERTGARKDLYGTEHHGALVWDGHEVRMYVDGKPLQSGLQTIDFEQTPRDLVRSKLNSFYLGAAASVRDGLSLSRFFRGSISQVLVSRSARYDAAFTPDKQFQADADSIALYRFDEGRGDVLKDSSGNGHHGQIKGAKWVRADISPGAGGAIVVPIAELNTSEYNACPWPSRDGLRLYWETANKGQTWLESRTVMASRPDLNSPFGSIQEVSVSGMPTLSGDELEIVAVPRNNAILHFSRRRSINDPFPQMQPIPVLRDVPRPKCPLLSADGLHFVVQSGSLGDIQFLSSRRSSVNESWSPPTSIPGMHEKDHGISITWPFLSDDGLRIWYGHGGDVETQIWTGTRQSISEPFADFKPVTVDGRILVGRTPRYVSATNELFFSQPIGEMKWSLAVVKNYRPGATGSAGSASVPARTIALFDDKTFAGWQSIDGNAVPADWTIEGDAIVAPGSKSSIATVAEYGDFELELEWKISAGANGGVFYGWHGRTISSQTDGLLVVAPEFQIVDNIGHPNGRKAETSAGSVFGLYAPGKDTTKPVGEWNQARIVVRGADVEHWLNGEQVVSYTRGSEDWKQRVAKLPRFGSEPEYSQVGPGRIVLQGYSGKVWYRNINLRSTPAAPNAAVPSATPGKITDINNPAFQKWIKDVQAMPAEKQVEEVARKLVELNPEFDGKVTGGLFNKSPKIETGVVTGFGFSTANVTDISPVRALVGLNNFSCGGASFNGGFKGKLTDLSPLHGMSLTTVHCGGNPALTDLSPLKGLPLTLLYMNNTRVTNLSPLQGMPLKELSISGSYRITDLTPLHGLPLTTFSCGHNLVSDLTPLKGMKLTNFSCYGTKVTDFSPLQGMPLTWLDCSGSKVTDLTPLKGMPLKSLDTSYTKIMDLSPLLDSQSLTTLKIKETEVTAAEVAALQKALPNCKITWDGPGFAQQLLSSPLDNLDPAAIPAEERFEWQPPELVAVIGSHASRHWEPPVAAAISPDGKLAATLAMSDGTFNTDNLIVWDLATQTAKWRLGVKCWDQAYLWFTPDSQRLVVMPRSEHIHVFTLNGPEPDVVRLVQSGITNPITHYRSTILEQGRTLAIPVQGSNQFSLHTADWKRGEITQAVSTSPQAQTKTRFLFANDANQAVYVSMEGKLRRATIRNAQWELAIPLAAGDKLSAVAPDGKRLTIQTTEGFQIWNIAGATPQKAGFIADSFPNNSSQFSPDGRWLTIKYTGAVLYRIDGAEPQRIAAVSSEGQGGAHASIAFSADGNQAVCTNGANFVRFWNLSGAEPVEQSAWDLNTAFSTRYWRPTLHPDDGRLLLSRFDRASRYSPRYQRWNLSGRTPVPSPNAQTFVDINREAGRILPAGPDTYVALSWWPDVPSAELYRFDGKVWKPSGSPFGPTRAVGETSHDGRLLVVMEAAGRPSELNGWNLSLSPPKEKWKLPIGQRELSSTYSNLRPIMIADNQHVLAAYVPGEVGKDLTKHELLLVHHLDTQPELLARIPVSGVRDRGGYAFALSRDGRFLAHSRDQQNELILEDISGPQPEQLQSMKLWLHGKFHWLSFSPDGRHLACATDENVIVLEVATFNTVWKWNAPGDIEWIEWAADGRHLVTLNSNQTAYVLRLNQLAPDVANVAPPEPAMPLGNVDPERHVAEWVLAHGGNLSLSDRRSVKTAAELPEGPFFITAITLANVNTKITPEEWQSLGDLQLVTGMGLSSSGVTDEALEAIAR